MSFCLSALNQDTNDQDHAKTVPNTNRPKRHRRTISSFIAEYKQTPENANFENWDNFNFSKIIPTNNEALPKSSRSHLQEKVSDTPSPVHLTPTPREKRKKLSIEIAGGCPGTTDGDLTLCQNNAKNSIGKTFFMNLCQNPDNPKVESQQRDLSSDNESFSNFNSNSISPNKAKSDNIIESGDLDRKPSEGQTDQKINEFYKKIGEMDIDEDFAKKYIKERTINYKRGGFKTGCFWDREGGVGGVKENERICNNLQSFDLNNPAGGNRQEQVYSSDGRGGEEDNYQVRFGKGRDISVLNSFDQNRVQEESSEKERSCSSYEKDSHMVSHQDSVQSVIVNN